MGHHARRPHARLRLRRQLLAELDRDGAGRRAIPLQDNVDQERRLGRRGRRRSRDHDRHADAGRRPRRAVRAAGLLREAPRERGDARVADPHAQGRAARRQLEIQIVGARVAVRQDAVTRLVVGERGGHLRERVGAGGRLARRGRRARLDGLRRERQRPPRRSPGEPHRRHRRRRRHGARRGRRWRWILGRRSLRARRRRVAVRAPGARRIVDATPDDGRVLGDHDDRRRGRGWGRHGRRRWGGLRRRTTRDDGADDEGGEHEDAEAHRPRSVQVRSETCEGDVPRCVRGPPAHASSRERSDTRGRRR